MIRAKAVINADNANSIKKEESRKSKMLDQDDDRLVESKIISFEEKVARKEEDRREFINVLTRILNEP